jgi:L-lactate dehydrogenase complex protein LldG
MDGIQESQMTTRDAILNDIRRNLGRTADTPPPPVRIRVPDVSRERRIASMLERVTALAGNAFHAHSKQQAIDYVAEVTNGKSRVVSSSPFLKELAITGDGENATAAFGITSADYALADTGSLVMISEARLVSLLPPVHIAVVPAERLLSGLDELYTILPKPADHTSSMVFITGPSRTADIEQILIRGVHGPGEIHVVIVG